MSRCIYCLEEKPRTIAHVIPKALGGSLTFNDVCRDCNSRQGSSFEGRTINSFLFSTARYRAALSTNYPLQKNPLTGLTFKSESEASVKLEDDLAPLIIPKLSTERRTEGALLVSATYDSRDKDRLVQDVAKTLFRKGIADDLEHAQILANSVVPLVKSQPHEAETLHTRIEIDLQSLTKLYVKIAYEAAYLHHGSSYLSDPSAKILRGCLNGSDWV